MIKIGLRPREMQVLSAAVNAWSLVGNGHYLCGAGHNARPSGRLSAASSRRWRWMRSFRRPWIVVVITPENVKALRAAQAAR
jgi:hypothetical protein